MHVSCQVITKQPEVMILKAPKEWDRRRERMVDLREELVKVKLDSLEKTTIVRAN